MSESYTVQNATLLEITCHGSCIFVVAPILLRWFVFGVWCLCCAVVFLVLLVISIIVQRKRELVALH